MPANDLIDVGTFNRSFAEKVSKVRSSTSDVTPPTFNRIQPDGSSVYVADVIDAVGQLPDTSDPMSTNVLKQFVHSVAPHFTELFNRSLAAGHFPSVYKEAFIMQTVKKAGQETTDVSSFRPISQIVSHIKASGAHRCSPTDGLFIVCRPPTYVAVWFLTESFD